MSIEISVSDARADMADLTGRVLYAGETVYLTKHGRRAAALVSASTAELLEQIEDVLDARAVAEALAEYEATGETFTLDEAFDGVDGE